MMCQCKKVAVNLTRHGGNLHPYYSVEMDRSAKAVMTHCVIISKDNIADTVELSRHAFFIVSCGLDVRL